MGVNPCQHIVFCFTVVTSIELQNNRRNEGWQYYCPPLKTWKHENMPWPAFSDLLTWLHCTRIGSRRDTSRKKTNTGKHLTVRFVLHLKSFFELTPRFLAKYWSDKNGTWFIRGARQFFSGNILAVHLFQYVSRFFSENDSSIKRYLRVSSMTSNMINNTYKAKKCASLRREGRASKFRLGLWRFFLHFSIFSTLRF